MKCCCRCQLIVCTTSRPSLLCHSEHVDQPAAVSLSLRLIPSFSLPQSFFFIIVFVIVNEFIIFHYWQFSGAFLGAEFHLRSGRRPRKFVQKNFLLPHYNTTPLKEEIVNFITKRASKCRTMHLKMKDFLVVIPADSHHGRG